MSLRPLSVENRERCAEPGVREDQRDLVDTSAFAGAESHHRPGWEPLAVYSRETIMEKFVGAGCVLGHITIDGRFQGGARDRAALLAAVERVRSSGCTGVRSSYWHGNPAVRLYEAVGFRHAGSRWGEGEPVMALPL